jgi:hypothetical protein
MQCVFEKTKRVRMTCKVQKGYKYQQIASRTVALAVVVAFSQSDASGN